MKKKLIIAIFMLLISSLAFGGNKSYDHPSLKIKFDYPENYDIVVNDKDTHHEIFITSQKQDAAIVILVLKGTLTKKFRLDFIKGLNKSLNQKGNKKTETSHSKQTLEIKDPSLESGVRTVSCNEEKLLYLNQNKDMLYYSILFFTIDEIGYVVTFTRSGTEDKEADFDVFRKSFTINNGLSPAKKEEQLKEKENIKVEPIENKETLVTKKKKLKNKASKKKKVKRKFATKRQILKMKGKNYFKKLQSKRKKLKKR